MRIASTVRSRASRHEIVKRNKGVDDLALVDAHARRADRQAACRALKEITGAAHSDGCPAAAPSQAAGRFSWPRVDPQQPVLPLHSEAASRWTMTSWDRTHIPKPYTTVAMAIVEPMYVPRDADDLALEQWRQRLQESPADCRRECADLLCRSC